MTAPAPKSREEWEEDIQNICRLYEDSFSNGWYKQLDSILESIMALQSEVERLQSINTQWEMLYAPVCEFVNANQKALGIGLGESIAEFVLNMLREKARQPK